jgi:Tfp pilus assembly protein PilF
VTTARPGTPGGGTIARPINTPGASTRYQPTIPSRVPSAAAPTATRAPWPGTGQAAPARTTTPIARDRYEPVRPASRPAHAADAARPSLQPREPRRDTPIAGRPAQPSATANRPAVVAGAASAGRASAMPTTRPSAFRPADVVPAVAPRLSPPRSTSLASTTPAAFRSAARPSYASATGYGHHASFASRHHRALWCDYWNPWPRFGVAAWSPWCVNPGWSFGWYGGAFSWHVSLWQPIWCWRSAYWYGCYNDAFWCGWSQPCYPASYWWYPTNVYCPTYLYVPNTVYVPSTVVVNQNVVSAPAPAAPAVQSTIVAAGGAPGAVVVRDEGAGTEERARSLAQKYVELGDFYFRDDRFRAAAEAYGKARSQVPDDASVHLVLADAVFADGDYHYAAFLVGEALRLDPAMASAATDKRTFYRDVKTFYAQMQALEAYLERAPYDAQAHFVKGYNLHFSARRDEAKKAFQRVLEIEPGHRGAELFLAAPQPPATPVGAPATAPSDIR